MMPGVFRIEGVVQHYDWGGKNFIPRLIREENAQEIPYAEYWLGEHPRGPAVVSTNGVRQSVRDLFREQPGVLGDQVTSRFGADLPYLLKVLDVRSMLSIQVHPDKASAERGYLEEEKLGIARDASNRIFRDRNHKPEMMMALSEFWLLHGFRPLSESLFTLRKFADLADLEANSIESLCGRLLALSPTSNKGPGAELLDLLENGSFERSSHHYWVKRALSDLEMDRRKLDPALFVIYMMQLVRLSPGQVIYQAPGVIHAYLEGQNIEVMAASDNVLRAGLTQKFVDRKRLVDHLRFSADPPDMIQPDLADGMSIYRPPVEDFQLKVIDTKKDKRIQLRTVGPEIFLVWMGAVEVGGSKFEQGEAFLVAAGAEVQLRVLDDNTQVFGVSVNLKE
jgi:mannose-6-phosphate isomerase